MTTRLVPAAVAAWSGALAVPLLSGLPAEPAGRHSMASAIAGVSALAGAVCLLSAVAVTLSSSPVRAKVAGMLVAVLVGCAAMTSAALHVARITDEPLASAAERGAEVTLLARITGDVRLRQAMVSGPVRGDDVLEARAHAIAARVEGRDWQVSTPILVRLPVQAQVSLGQLVEVRGRLRALPMLRGLAGSLDAASFAVVEQPSGLMAMAAAVRSGLREALAGADPRAAALVEGLAVGDETGQPPALARQMRDSGLSHLTAVSGGNTAIVIGAALLLAGLLGLPIAARAALALVALGGFVAIVGPQPSVLRAAAMGVVAIVALLVGRPRQGLAALAGCTVALLLLSPPLAASWGFALSVAATAGLLVIAPRLVRRWSAGVAVGSAGPPRLATRIAVGSAEPPRLALRLAGSARGMSVRRSLAEAIALTLAAQVATLPLVAAFGAGLSLVSVPANLLAAPAVAPVTILGLAAALASPVWAPLARVLAGLAEPPAAWIALVAERAADLPGAVLPWPGGLEGALLAGVVLAGSAVLLRAREWRARHPALLRLAATVALAVVAILALRVPERAGWPPPGWLAVACDVGQGDAFVVRTADAAALVVDAGPSPDLVDACLDDLGVEQVPLLVLTHDHADHVEGIPGVLEGRVVGQALISPLRDPVAQAERVDAWLERVPVVTAVPGMTFTVGTAAVTVLWPQRVIRSGGSAANNASVVLLVESAGVRLLLLGDVEPAAQVALRSSLRIAAVDVVKVPHHGSRFQDPVLPDWTSGRAAIVSVGEGNDYGHPAPETIDAWEAAGALIGRTDLDGDVAVVRTDDGGLALVGRRGRPS